MIHEGLVPKLPQTRVHTSQNYGNLVFHKLARAWRTVFMYQLRASRIPEGWKTEAAEVPRRLGGRGDMVKAILPPR